jgi:hypothetical protein
VHSSNPFPTDSGDPTISIQCSARRKICASLSLSSSTYAFVLVFCCVEINASHARNGCHRLCRQRYTLHISSSASGTLCACSPSSHMSRSATAHSRSSPVLTIKASLTSSRQGMLVDRIASHQSGRFYKTIHSQIEFKVQHLQGRFVPKTILHLCQTWCDMALHERHGRD